MLGLVVISCAVFEPLKISVPGELSTATKMDVSGGERSIQFEIGPFQIRDIYDRPGRVLYTDFKSTYYKIKAFEFKIGDPLGNEFECWCEYPQRSLFDERIRCSFEDSRNLAIRWNLADTTLVQGNNEIRFETYFKTDNKQRIGSTMMGYVFTISDSVCGLVDISSARSEALWLHPEMNSKDALATAAASTAFILKHRQLHYQQQLEEQVQEADYGI